MKSGLIMKYVYVKIFVILITNDCKKMSPISMIGNSLQKQYPRPNNQ